MLAKEPLLISYAELCALTPTKEIARMLSWGLEEAQCLDDDTIRYLIDPKHDRRDKRCRDTDWGVRGACAAALIRQFRNGEAPPPELLRLVVEMLAESETRLATIGAALAPLEQLSIEDARAALSCLYSAADDVSESPNPQFLRQLESHRSTLEKRERRRRNADCSKLILRSSSVL